MENETKHTHGPWRYDEVTMKIWSADGEKNITGKLDDYTPEERANVALIAAAPELLEALKSARRLLEVIEMDGLAMIESQFAEEIAVEIESAIAKANT